MEVVLLRAAEGRGAEGRGGGWFWYICQDCTDQYQGIFFCGGAHLASEAMRVGECMCYFLPTFLCSGHVMSCASFSIVQGCLVQLRAEGYFFPLVFYLVSIFYFILSYLILSYLVHHQLVFSPLFFSLGTCFFFFSYLIIRYFIYCPSSTCSHVSFLYLVRWFLAFSLLFFLCGFTDGPLVFSWLSYPPLSLFSLSLSSLCPTTFRNLQLQSQDGYPAGDNTIRGTCGINGNAVRGIYMFFFPFACHLLR